MTRAVKYFATSAFLLFIMAGCSQLQAAAPYLDTARRAVDALAEEFRPDAEKALQDCQAKEKAVQDAKPVDVADRVAELAAAQARLAGALARKGGRP